MGEIPYPIKENPEREGFELSMGVSTHSAFPGLRTGVQLGAPADTTYSDSHRWGRRKAGEGTRVGTLVGLASTLATE
jgi:hypothetical protein